MKALVMHKYKELTYEEVPRPEPKEGEVLIRLKACSVCGSDVHGFDGSTGRRKPPIIMGHEASGVIAACGEGVKSHKAGDRVTFDSTVYCNTCDMCRKGLVNLCANRQVLGVSCITNMAAGVLDQPIDHQEVMEMGRRARREFSLLLTETIKKIP